MSCFKENISHEDVWVKRGECAYVEEYATKARASTFSTLLIIPSLPRHTQSAETESSVSLKWMVKIEVYSVSKSICLDELRCSLQQNQDSRRLTQNIFC